MQFYEIKPTTIQENDFTFTGVSNRLQSMYLEKTKKIKNIWIKDKWQIMYFPIEPFIVTDQTADDRLPSVVWGFYLLKESLCSTVSPTACSYDAVWSMLINN